MINIDSDQGRIGELWWINSDPSTTHRVAVPFAGARVHLDLYRWGTCGYGRDIKVWLEPIND
jgi:hypothetical protein